MIEASPSAYRSGMLAVGKNVPTAGRDLRRFYTTPPPFYCGIDVHARSLDVCSVHHEGAMRRHRPMQAAPDPVLKAGAPDRDRVGGAVAGLFPWYGRAALGAAEGSAGVLGHALSL